ncbi:GumC family protein [Sporocytophaga myxococcoides]|uniref:GumC family protein n=1 Tax=Sporocytophaga myxococcoides TaxID=153721 RepID=UPI00040456C4|nr:Wzz/FepE/Etk N-terminal domain-containing protein [Sporocytophaga myxococcoides]
MDFKLFLKVLLKRKWLILGITILSSMATFLLVSRAPKIYVSSAQLATGFTERNDEKNENAVTITNKFNNLTEIINSPHCMSLVSYRLVLNDLRSEQPFGKVYKVKDEFNTEELTEIVKVYKAKYDSLDIIYGNDDREMNAVKVLKILGYEYPTLTDNFTVTRVPNSDYIEVKFSSTNPKLSAYAVNVLCDEVTRYYAYIKNQKSESSLNYYSKILVEKKEELDSKIDSLNKFKELHAVTNYGLETQAKLDQAARLELSREEEYKKIQALKRALALIKKELNRGGIDESEVSSGSSNSKIYDLKGKISDLNNRYVVSGMTNKILRDSLNSLRNQLENQISRSLNENTGGSISNAGIDLMEKKINTEIELEIATENLSSIESSIISLKGNLSNFATKETAISRLELAVSVAKEEYLRILDKFNAAKSTSANAGNIRQSELGLPANGPQPTNKSLLTILAGVISFTFCIVFVFVLEYLDVSVRTPSNFVNLTNFVLLGSLQKINIKKGNLLTAIDASNSNDAFRNQLRKVRFQMEQSNSKVFLFTSTQKGQGKSFSILALANTLSLNNNRILIIDSNLKGNNITRALSAKVKIENYLNLDDTNSNKDLAQCGFNLITKTDINGVDLIASKNTLASPSEFFAGRNFVEFLNMAKEKYDFILLEASDLNEYPDAYEFVIYADKVIGVISADSEIKNVDKRSFDFLSSLNGKFAGFVLNKVEPDHIIL